MPLRYRIRRIRQGAVRIRASGEERRFPNHEPAQQELPELSDFTRYWQRIFTAARDKAILELHRKGAPIYTIQNGEVVEVKLDI